MSDAASQSRVIEIRRWSQRSPETAALLNPAFLGVVVACAMWEHQLRAGTGLDLPTVFLIPPLVLHSETRKALPRDARTHLSTWVIQYPTLRAGIPRRVLDLAPLVREAL